MAVKFGILSLCSICKFIITQVDGMLELGVEGVEAISKAIQYICETFEVEDPTTCTVYIDQLPQIIEDLINNMKPEDVCKELTMC